METALVPAELSRFLPPGVELFAVSFLTISRRALKGGSGDQPDRATLEHRYFAAFGCDFSFDLKQQRK